MWVDDVWPQNWTCDDIDADEPIDQIIVDGQNLVRQALLMK